MNSNIINVLKFVLKIKVMVSKHFRLLDLRLSVRTPSPPFKPTMAQVNHSHTLKEIISSLALDRKLLTTSIPGLQSPTAMTPPFFSWYVTLKTSSRTTKRMRLHTLKARVSISKVLNYLLNYLSTYIWLNKYIILDHWI